MTRELSPVVGYSRRRRGRAAAVAVAAAAAVAVAVGSVSRGSTRKASGIIKDGTQKARASKLSQPGVHAGRSGHGQFHETHGISASAENIRTCMLEIGLRAPGVEKVWTCLEALSECSPTVWNAAENGRSPEILAGERRAEVAADMHRLRLLNPALFALLWCHQLLKKPGSPSLWKQIAGVERCALSRKPVAIFRLPLRASLLRRMALWWDRTW